MKLNDILEVAGIESAAVNPTPAFLGRLYFNTADSSLKVYDGSAWLTLQSDALVNPAYINVLSYATGDGTTDDYASIMLAEAAAFAAGKSLFFPPGTYAFTGATALSMRVSCYGVKGYSVLKRTGVTAAINYTLNSGASGIIFDGLTVNANSLVRGIQINDDDCTVRDCSVTSALGFGIGAFSCDRTLVENCHVSGVSYEATLNNSDGIYFGGCSDAVARGNHVEDFKRLGITSESDTPTLSARFTAINNLVHNAHDLDSSVGQYNGGIWVENTNGCVIRDNRIYDIGGNAGQTAARIQGITIGAGSTTFCEHIISGNFVEIASGTTPTSGQVGIYLNGNAFSSVTVRDNLIRLMAKGIVLGNGFKRVSILDNTVDALQITSVNSAAFFVDNAGHPCDSIVISNLIVTNKSAIGGFYDYADIDFYSLAEVTNGVSISGCFGLKLSSRNSGIGSFHISNCELTYGDSTGYSCLYATRIYAVNSQFTFAGDGETNGRVVSLQSDKNALFVNCRFVGGRNIITGSSTGQLRFTNCQFSNFYFRDQATGTYQITFDGCDVNSYDATYGFFSSNENTPTASALAFRNCAFQNGSDITPLKKNVQEPNAVEISGCRLLSAITSLHDFTITAGTVIKDDLAVFKSTGTPALITAVGGITTLNKTMNELQFIAGSGGAIDVTANPQISAGKFVGQRLKLIGKHATNTVLLENGTGLVLNGSYTMLDGSVIALLWDGTNWVEEYRNDL